MLVVRFVDWLNQMSTVNIQWMLKTWEAPVSLGEEIAKNQGHCLQRMQDVEPGREIRYLLFFLIIKYSNTFLFVAGGLSLDRDLSSFLS